MQIYTYYSWFIKPGSLTFKIQIDRNPVTQLLKIEYSKCNSLFLSCFNEYIIGLINEMVLIIDA